MGKICENIVENFLLEEFQDKISVWFNLYNFVSIWYRCSMMDGIVSHDKISQFVNDFVSDNEIDEDFEKTLKKLYEKLKKIKPGDFEG